MKKLTEKDFRIIKQTFASGRVECVIQQLKSESTWVPITYEQYPYITKSTRSGYITTNKEELAIRHVLEIISKENSRADNLTIVSKEIISL